MGAVFAPFDVKYGEVIIEMVFVDQDLIPHCLTADQAVGQAVDGVDDHAVVAAADRVAGEDNAGGAGRDHRHHQHRHSGCLMGDANPLPVGHRGRCPER